MRSQSSQMKRIQPRCDIEYGTGTFEYNDNMPLSKRMNKIERERFEQAKKVEEIILNNQNIRYYDLMLN